MTDPRALIAEARERAARLLSDEPCSPIITEALISRLADALEEATLPEGWRVAGYHNEHGAMVNEDTAGTWWITKADGLTGTAKDGTCEFTTARAAMEALEGEKAG